MKVQAALHSQWNASIRQTLPVTRAQAEAAIELTHRTAGDVDASKCAFPRPAVVLFDDKEEPVASINICFSCTDILVWPPYGTGRLLKKKYAYIDTLNAVHDEIMPRWQLYFDGLGADRYKAR